jgi:hypothetical protein
MSILARVSGPDLAVTAFLVGMRAMIGRRYAIIRFWVNNIANGCNRYDFGRKASLAFYALSLSKLCPQFTDLSFDSFDAKTTFVVVLFLFFT